jgi:hypothetical protein
MLRLGLDLSKSVHDSYAVSNYFLSMREFKRVGSGRELMCFVPYP